MKRSLNLTILISIIIIAVYSNTFAQTKEAPVDVAVNLIVRLLSFEEKISGGGDINIYILDDTEMASLFKNAIGTEIGKAKIKKVEEGKDLPKEKPTILIVNDSARVAQVIEYTWAQKVMSVTRKPDLVSMGVTLGVGIGEDLNFKTYINMKGTEAENIKWKQSILMIATKIE